MKFEERYSLIRDGSRPEEIVLLLGRGCFWKKCTFCDYHLDRAGDEVSVELDNRVLDQVTGETGRLTAINSGSFFELPKTIQTRVIEVCKEKGIKDLSIEAHWAYKDQVRELKEDLRKQGINLHPRIGIETFDESFREKILNKGFGTINMEELTDIFEECCLLFGIKGQSLEGLKKDLELAEKNFDYVYLNIYEQRLDLKEDNKLKEQFVKELLPELQDKENIIVMMNPTDLGVGD